MKVAFLMDPLGSMSLNKDSSYALMKAALQLKQEVYHFELLDLSLFGSTPRARVRKLSGLAPDGAPEVERAQQVDLDVMDAIWVRKDPPFDRRYFYATLILDYLKPQVFVINGAQALRDINEKLGALFFSHHAPKTLVSSDRDEIEGFLRQFERGVIKPLDGFGGKGIEFVSSGQQDLALKIDSLTHKGSRWIVANEFVEGAKLGDKRVLLVEGEPIGAILRKSESGDLHNLDQGGKAYPVELTEADLKVCAEMKQFLLAHKLFFVGIDMLGDSLTEVNVTSPTGLQELSHFSGVDWPTKIMSRVAELCQSDRHQDVLG